MFSLETFLTIRQNSLYVTVCMIVRTFYQGYFIHSLSTLYYYNAPSLTTRLTGNYRDRTCTGKRGPALLDTLHNEGAAHPCSSLFVPHMIMLCKPDSRFGVISLHLRHFLKFVLNLFGRNRSQKADDHVHSQTNQECRKKFVDSKCAAHRTDQEFPYKYHDSTADHTS